MEIIHFLGYITLALCILFVALILVLPPKGKQFFLVLITGSINTAGGFVYELNRLADHTVVFMHALGKFIIVLAFVITILIIADDIATLYGHYLFKPQGDFSLFMKHYKAKESWIPITALLATIVALGQFRNLKHTLSGNNA